MSGKGYHRRKFLIRPKFQLTIIGFSVGLALIAVAVLYFENMLLLNIIFDKETRDIFMDSAMIELMESERARVHRALGFASLTLLSLIAVGGLFLSHKVAGPIHRLQTHMEDTIQGKTRAELTFRKGDFFLELAEVYNRLLNKLKK